jgi:hypothetical protein
VDSRCNVFDPCFADLDCGDDGAPLVAHLKRPAQILEFLLLSKAAKSAAKSAATLFSLSHRAAHFFSQTSAHDAMSLIHV